MKSSRRDFIRRALFGGAVAGVFSRAVARSGGPVDRRKLGRVGVEVSILGLGLGSSFMDAFSHRLDAGHATLESALAKGINYWDTARSYGPSESMVAPVLERNRSRVFLASKSDARDYDGFKRDLERSLQILRTNYIDLYQLHDLGREELANLSGIESGAVRAAREAKEQKIIRAFGITGHSDRGVLMECIKRFDPDTVLTIFLATEAGKGTYNELLNLARSRQVGVIAMKTIRYARGAKLPPSELLRYALSLNGVSTAIVGLDSVDHLNENAIVATGFRAMNAVDRLQLHQNASQALAGVEPPWALPDYTDGNRVG
jgi:aryl-alcohol dehydrogenase-like predicted oxidoreductase